MNIKVYRTSRNKGKGNRFLRKQQQLDHPLRHESAGRLMTRVPVGSNTQTKSQQLPYNHPRKVALICLCFSLASQSHLNVLLSFRAQLWGKRSVEERKRHFYLTRSKTGQKSFLLFRNHGTIHSTICQSRLIGGCTSVQCKQMKTSSLPQFVSLICPGSSYSATH